MSEGKNELPDAHLLKRFEVVRLLGKGAYGIVWKVKEKETGRIFALKKCFDAFQNSTDAQRTFREIIFLQELNGHENIVRLMNVLKAESSQDLYVMFDFMESDLQRAIAGNLLQPIHVEYVTYQILKALKYVHSGGVLHRDLKPANVLLNSNCHVRLCDFGLARTALPVGIQAGGRRNSAAADEAMPLLTDYVATRWYRAPELLLGSTLYSEGVDMWSVGCILGEMVSGKPILRGRSTMDQLEKVVELTGKPSEQDLRPITTTSQYARTMLENLGNVRQMPSSGVLFLLKLPAQAKTLTLNLLKFNPDRRPSAEIALQDIFLEKFYGQASNFSFLQGAKVAERSGEHHVRQRPFSDVENREPWPAKPPPGELALLGQCLGYRTISKTAGAVWRAARYRGVTIAARLTFAVPAAVAYFHKKAFAKFDGGQGFIDVQGLSNALNFVKLTVEAGTQHSLLHRNFQVSTCCWLMARFGSQNRLALGQWCELMDYVSNLKMIFLQVDTDRSGAIEFAELHRAFQLSGVNLEAAIIVEVGQSYDSDKDGSLEFDEFVQMRLEWDCYIAAWDMQTQGAGRIAPNQLLQVLEEIKRSLEPLGTMLGMSGLTGMSTQGIFYASMFGSKRPFHLSTCERLIIRFGQGSLFLNFEQFCSMMVFLKEMKSAFSSLDNKGSGSLQLPELCNAFWRARINLPEALIQQIGKSFDSDNSGGIEFDEFIQMTAEWHEMWKLQDRFSTTVAAEELSRMLGSVQVIYQVINGSIQTLRPFSLNTCRWLIAKFGTCQAGERFAKRLSYQEFLNLVQYLKDCYITFLRFDFNRMGSLGAEHLGSVLAAFGLTLSADAVDNIRLSYDVDRSNRLSFDEFLQMLLEVQLYEQCFSNREQNPALLTPLNTLSPILGQSLAGGMSSGIVALDRSAFFSLVFAVPRQLTLQG
ncbi:erkB [Symbiodinium pilosum]|uniref:Mitogen-activated protein kinase n=1 Tax=Symbiodinium pilosum TaxID=2952 RepID=A0A812V538_SYMPI|nr:erkB [Symbiodinium pilosum]